MRTLARITMPLVFAFAFAALVACGSNNAPTLPDGGPVPPGDTLCTRSSQCPAGQGCIGNICTLLPCGGCDTDSVCSSVSNTCVPAQGATCPTIGGCPQGYICNSNNVCSAPCTIDSDCGSGLVCNSNTQSCAQCIFDSNCTSIAGKPRCEQVSGTCVACLNPIDCTSTVGSGHFCDNGTHSCQVGCESNSDCNLSNGERCNGATAGHPGMCIQCTAATEGADCNVNAPACDATGHCVICTADRYCGPATPRCDMTTQTCVQCLPANDRSGADCGYSFASGGTKDPHDENVCDPTAKSCKSGCIDDVNCGCPIDPSTHQQTSCARKFVQEHCDVAKTTSADVTGPSRGACVECIVNSHCFCKIKGNQNGADPSTGLSCAMYAGAGSYNGARCITDTCTPGCDNDADCPSNKLCSTSGPTAHTCVECSCAHSTIQDGQGACNANTTTCGWCADPMVSGQLGGCGEASDLSDGGFSGSAPSKVCDVKTLTCRLKRQDEQCVTSSECGDTLDPSVGQCIPGARFCVKYAHAYAVNSPNQYCDPSRVGGRCGIACNDSQDNQCSSGVACPNGSSCKQATATSQPPGGGALTGEYCTANTCTTAAP